MSGIFFPRMHPDLVAGPCPDWVHFLSPGMPRESDQYPFFLPQALPLSEKESSVYARKVSEFATQFRNPRELSGLGSLGGQTPFYQETVQALREDLKAHLHKDGQEQKGPNTHMRLQAQMNLIMAWMIEEQAADLHGLGRSLQAFQRSMDECLGLEEGARQAPWLDITSGEQTASYLVPWAKLLPWFVLFLGPRDALVIADPEIREQGEEKGLKFQATRPVDHSEFLPEAAQDDSKLLTALGPGTALMDNAGSGEDFSWMHQEIRIFCLPQAAYS